MTNEVARLRPGELQPAQPANVGLPTTVESIMARLQDAIANLKPDDVSVELSAHQDGHRSSARFSFRAYRRGNKVVDERGEVAPNENPDA